MLGIIRGLTDTFSMSEWNVVWLDNKGKYHKKYFYYKTEARFFYDLLPFYHKRLERVR
ncbi:phage protein [Staphylococcus aureus]|nr:phage protein [Staphylococcus aureus]CAA4048806.1 phage protein [Staphylococcus aureus]CAA4053061.1 phage protein [Staphylococcus aureus]